MNKVFQLFLKSAWVPFVCFLVFIFLKSIYEDFFSTSSPYLWGPTFWPYVNIQRQFMDSLVELFYSNRGAYYFLEKFFGILVNGGLLIFGLLFVFSVFYKIKNKLWQSLLCSIALVVLACGFYGGIQFTSRKAIIIYPRNIESRDRMIRGELGFLAKELELYRTNKGYYPQSLVEVDMRRIGELVEEGSMNSFLGAPFQYQLSADGKRFSLKSSGSDGEFGTVDDVVWNQVLH